MENLTPKSVMIIDDNLDNLRLLVDILEKEGYRCRPTTDVSHAISSIQKEPPDLILLDIMMPKWDGYEVCKELKDNQNTAGIPIIFISALNDISDKTKAFNSGGIDYITKPFNSLEVLARVKTHITIKHLVEKLEKKNLTLEKALNEIKTLRGIIPICSSCKSIRDEKGYWHRVEAYITKHSQANLSHGICEKCAEKLYPELNITFPPYKYRN